jgi:hypothetical protein
MKFRDRYAMAVDDGVPRDVIHAAGVVARRAPLAMALTRFFVGGDQEAKSVSAILRRMAVGKAWRMGDPIGEAAADLIAGMVLQWHRDSSCRLCGGHGYKTMLGELGEGRTVIGDSPCPDCKGTGKRSFDRLFPRNRLAARAVAARGGRP